jgi:hypothetical protein
MRRENLQLRALTAFPSEYLAFIRSFIDAMLHCALIPEIWKTYIRIAIHKHGGGQRPLAIPFDPYAVLGLVTYLRGTRAVYSSPTLLSPFIFSFRPEMGCNTPNFIRRALLEDAQQKDKRIYLLSLDLAKYYDSVTQDLVAAALHHLGAPQDLSDLVQETFHQVKPNVRRRHRHPKRFLGGT